MRISPTKLLHGLLYTAPILLLTLAACGGGGGGGSTPPVAPLASAYTLSVNVTGVSGVVALRNGGETLSVSASGTYPFVTKVVAGTNYNVAVLTHPSGPAQLCTVPAPTASMPAVDTTIAVNCVDAFTIGGDFTGTVDPVGAGLVLQNNGTDDLLVPAGATNFVFSTPLVASATYAVTVLTQPHNPPQSCGITGGSGSGTVSGTVSTVTINCLDSAPLLTDPYVYTANNGTDDVSTFTSASGVLSATTPANAGDQPYAIAVNPTGSHAYVVNYNADTVSAYSIASGALAPLVPATVAAGNGPRAISIHPSGNFAYVANYLDNSVSAYSITAGVLARIDSDGVAAGSQLSIPARVGPTSIAIDPLGGYAYVANRGVSGSAGSVSVYSIDVGTGALTAIDADGVSGSTDTFIPAGLTTSSVAIDPDGQYLYVTNSGSPSSISIYSVNAADGSLAPLTPKATAYSPSFITIYPGGGYAYVADSTNDQILVYAIDPNGSLPIATADIEVTGSLPISISIDSTGQNAYVANSGSNDGTGGISAYDINPANGALTAVGSSPFTSGSNPYAVTTSQ